MIPLDATGPDETGAGPVLVRCFCSCSSCAHHECHHCQTSKSEAIDLHIYIYIYTLHALWLITCAIVLEHMRFVHYDHQQRQTKLTIY
jgi:hypothetical protein